MAEPKKDLLDDVKKFDHTALKDVEEIEKTPSQARDMALAGIENFRPGSLKQTETVEKNLLPSKEDIELEKKLEEAGETDKK